MDKYNFNEEALIEISIAIKKFLSGNLQVTYDKGEFISFSKYSDKFQSLVMYSLDQNKNSFHGNVDGGGHFSGRYSAHEINIQCSQTGQSIKIKI